MSTNKSDKKNEKSKQGKKHARKDEAKQPQDGKKKKKQAKREALQGHACPCCKKHCPLTDPKCSKGKAIRKKLLRDAGLVKD